MYLSINLIIPENFILCSLPLKEPHQQITSHFSLGCDQLKDLKEVAKRNVIKTSSVEKTVKKKQKKKTVF